MFLADGRLLRVDLIKCWKKFHSKCGICPEDIFVLARSGITRILLRLDFRWRSFVLRVAFTWNSLPDDVVALETLGSHLFLLERKIVSFRLACFLKIFSLIITCLLYCSFIWLLLFGCSAIFVFCYFCLFIFKFNWMKLLISLFVLLTYCFVCFFVL